MAKVKVAQTDGEIIIAVGNDTKRFSVSDGVVTTNQADAELLVANVDGASIEAAKK